MTEIAAILSVGDELVLGQTVDTNSAYIAAQLAAIGIMTRAHRTVGDDRTQIARTVAELAADHDLLLITGGLGPTLDDLTRLALGDVLTPGEELVEDEAARVHVHEWFAKRGREMSPANHRLVLKPRTMTTLPNPVGTALGLVGSHGRSRLFVMPGPPFEMQPMFESHVLPALSNTAGDRVIVCEQVHTFGIGESIVADRLGDLMSRDRNPSVGTTIGRCLCTCRIRIVGSARSAHFEAQSIIEEVERRLEPFAFSRGETGDLPTAVGDLLRRKGATLCTAESCTGGMLGEMITHVAGSSDYFLGGWVTYGNDMKSSQLGVPNDVLTSHGAVSAETATSMATGALQRCGATFALAITGIAGPGGGVPDKPVGTVYIARAARTGSPSTVAGKAASHSADSVVDVRRFVIPGSRQTMRERASLMALQMLRLHLIGRDDVDLSWQQEEPAPKS